MRKSFIFDLCLASACFQTRPAPSASRRAHATEPLGPRAHMAHLRRVRRIKPRGAGLRLAP